MKPTRESTGTPRSDRNLPIVLYLLPWAFVVLAALKLKNRLLVAEGGGYDFLAEALGIGHAGALGFAERVALFRYDVLIVVVIGAIAFLGLIRLVAPRHRAWVAWLVSMVLFLIFYAQLKSWWEVGTFISARLMAAGLFGPGRELIGEYASSATVQRLFLSLTVLTMVCVGLGVLERYAGKLNLSRLTGWAAWPLTVGAAALVVVSWLPRIPSTPFDRAATTASLVAFSGHTGYSGTPPDLRSATSDELMATYARLANAPVPNRRSEHFGKARGYDVVFILMETLPDVCYSMSYSEGALPAIRELERHSFVATSHYSTYPYSRSAYTSIFSSWYPVANIHGDIARFGKISRDLRAPGVVHSASVSGYHTAAFVPERPQRIEEDELRYAALGFAEHLVPPSAYEKSETLTLDNSLRGWVRRRDRESFDEMKERISKAIEHDQRYLFSFNPQYTHGPWPGITSDDTPEETCRAGQPLLREIDGMVGELTALLREKKRLDKTLIVVVGDHGLRTRREYPPFHAGTLDDVTFHVPMLLHAPGVLSATEKIPWMTSHIDLAPSVLDLLGIETDRALELGSPMWDPKIADRATFFFAKGYLGADGYQRDGQAVMVRYLYGGVSRSPWNGTLSFRLTDLMRKPDAALLHEVDNLTLMSAIQTELSRTMLPGVGHLSRPRLERPGTAAVRATETVRPASGSVSRSP